MGVFDSKRKSKEATGGKEERLFHHVIFEDPFWTKDAYGRQVNVDLL